jgi:1,4-dihydroxy-2-naphthoate octaprenyltransferase
VRPTFWKGVHRLADPKVTLASAASILLGAAAAGRDGAVSWGWLALTALGIFCLEAAKNASGELVDFASGVDQAVSAEDRSPFSGGKRVLVEDLMTRGETAAVAAVGYTLCIAIGVVLAAFRHTGVLWLGLAGVALAFFYHARPLRLSYRGLGELAVAAAYGPLVACGTYLVQRQAWGREVWLASIPLGLLIAAFLWINEFPDYRADSAAGKKTLVVRLGRPAASRVFAAIHAVAFLLLAWLPAWGLPRTVWLGAVGLPFAALAAGRLWSDPETTTRIVPAQGWTLLAFLGYSIGVSAGMLLAARPGG